MVRIGDTKRSTKTKSAMRTIEDVFIVRSIKEPLLAVNTILDASVVAGSGPTLLDKKDHRYSLETKLEATSEAAYAPCPLRRFHH